MLNGSQSVHDSLISMLSQKCTEMAALADQEALRRQSVEVQLTQSTREREALRVMNETLTKEKFEIERERSQLSTALTETRSQNQALQHQVTES